MSAERVTGFGQYRIWTAIVGAAWILGLAALLLVGRRRRRSTETRAVPPPTFAARLRPLIERGIAGTISPSECAALERLLIDYWAERLDLRDKKPAQVFRVLRDHPEASALVLQLETWLHRPSTSQDCSEPVDLQSLLAPYLHPAASPAEPVVSGA
ncbi:MAG: hypothetical protein QM775_31795 [Pirellulales bacterium]